MRTKEGDAAAGEEAPANAQPSKQAMREETRKRMARINSFLDMIPAQFVLGYDHPLIQESQKNLDPAKAKRTSALLVEAALQERKSDEGEKSSSVSRNAHTGKKRKLKQSASAPPPAPKDGEEAQPNSREELHQKLERRLAELREERRKRQSEADKATAKAIREAREKAREAEAKAQQAADRSREASWQQRGDAGEAEVGRLVFNPKSSSLPYGADVNRRGQKTRRMRNELRKQEVMGEKMKAAEARGDGDEFRKNLGLEKALLRAQGQKIHDDVNKMRKAQKLMDVRKKKGRDKREGQKEDVKRQQDEKQTRRKENLAKRANSKKKKKGRSGFEGKRDGYMNKEA